MADYDVARATRFDAHHPVLLKFAKLTPLVGALAYPYLLQIFHSLVVQHDLAGPGGFLMAVSALLAALSIPVFALSVAIALGRISDPTEFELRARRLAFVSVAAPPLFVLFGVGLGLLGSPVSDLTAWNFCWTLALLFGAVARDNPSLNTVGTMPKLRVFHGVTAALLMIFVLFHLSNHLVGLLGADAHKFVMETGRTVYRSGAVEPLLIGLLLLQILSGGRLAWQWSKLGGDFYRMIQIGSGIYVGAFILTHLNSALISARLVKNIPTDWAWASGAPEGLLLDAWNIRLAPHYAFGVFFLLIHLCSGLRIVLLAHGVEPRIVRPLWAIGILASGLVASTIMAALCGFRI